MQDDQAQTTGNGGDEGVTIPAPGPGQNPTMPCPGKAEQGGRHPCSDLKLNPLHAIGLRRRHPNNICGAQLRLVYAGKTADETTVTIASYGSHCVEDGLRVLFGVVAHAVNPRGEEILYIAATAHQSGAVTWEYASRDLRGQEQRIPLARAKF